MPGIIRKYKGTTYRITFPINRFTIYTQINLYNSKYRFEL